MFKLFNRTPAYQTTDFHKVARQYPGKLVILPNHIVVYLGDVDVMSTIHLDTRKLTGEECLAAVKNELHQDRHPQLYL
jgi:hypothetical protein